MAGTGEAGKTVLKHTVKSKAKGAVGDVVDKAVDNVLDRDDTAQGKVQAVDKSGLKDRAKKRG